MNEFEKDIVDPEEKRFKNSKLQTYMTAWAQYDFMSWNANATLWITGEEHNISKFLISVDEKN